MRIFKVKGCAKFVGFLSEYKNGYLTTAGFYSPNVLEEILSPTFGITYDSDACTELPINWPDLYVLDDNNNRQRIKEIDYKHEGPAYTMEDGTKSWEVTI